MNGPHVEETSDEKAIRAWLAGSAPAQAPASLRETLESVTAGRPASYRSRSWSAGRLARLLGAAAAAAILALIVASVFDYSHSPAGQSSPTLGGAAGLTPAPTATPTTTSDSNWRLVADQLPNPQPGEASPGGSIVFARPEGGFVVFVVRQDKDFKVESEVLTSPDGTVWTTQSTVHGSVEAVAYSGKTAVAVGCSNYGGPGDGTNSFMSWTTSDFKTWTSAILPGAASGPECVYNVSRGPGGYVAETFTQTASNLFWSSPDGTSWKRVTTTGLPDKTHVDTMFAVAGGYALEGLLTDRPATWFSPDGANWTQTWSGPAPVGYEYYRLGTILQATGGGYVSFGSVDQTSRQPIWTSRDGLHWTLSQTLSQAEAPGQGQIPNFGKGPNGYVAAIGGYANATAGSVGAPLVWTSTDGTSWQPETLPAAVAKMPANYAWVVSDGSHVIIVCVGDASLYLLVE
jgi:hypothetical protein